MKLFGNNRHGQHVKSKLAQKEEKKNTAIQSDDVSVPEKKKSKTGFGARWKALPLALKILIVVLAVLLVLVIAVAIWWALNVKPPAASNTIDSSPMTTTTTRVDEETGEEYEVEVYSDGEEAFQAPTTKTVTKVDEETGEEYEYEIPVSKKEGFYNILIAGTDGDGGRTDTIMIASLDTTTHEVALMSIPRDTYISANYSVPKINSAYGAGGMGEEGMAALKNQLAKLLGFEVDGYVLVDLEAFVEIVDLVGGVEFNVPMNMYYSDPSQNLYINLSAGLQVLDGEHAIQLVRYRSGYASADIQRTTVQQDFLRALAKQCLQFNNIDKVTEMAEIVATYVTTDLTVGNIIYFAMEVLQCDFDEMVTVTLPGQSISINGGSYYALYKNQVLEIVNEYFNPYDTEITASDVTILGSASSSGSVTYNTGSSNHGSYGTGSSSGSSSSGSSSSGTSSSASETSQAPETSETPEETTPAEELLPTESMPAESSETSAAPTESTGSSGGEPTNGQTPSTTTPSGSDSGTGSTATEPSASQSGEPAESSAPAETGAAQTPSDSGTGSTQTEDSGASAPADNADILPTE